MPCKYCDKSGFDHNLRKCKHCDGRKFYYREDCKLCHNTGGMVKKIQEVIHISENIKNGEKIVIKGRGNQKKNTYIYGDVNI